MGFDSGGGDAIPGLRGQIIEKQLPFSPLAPRCDVDTLVIVLAYTNGLGATVSAVYTHNERLWVQTILCIIALSLAAPIFRPFRP